MDNKSNLSLPIFPSLVQVAATALTLSVLYLIFGLSRTVEFEMISQILWLFIIPVFGIGTLLVGCVLIGFPIRTIRAIHVWWLSRQIIPFLGLVIGLILVVLTRYEPFLETWIVLEEEQEIVKEGPDFRLLISGAALVAFSMLHFHPRYFIAQAKAMWNK